MNRIIEADKNCFMKIYGLGERNRYIAAAATIGTKLSYLIFLLIFASASIYIALYLPSEFIRFTLVPLSALLINTFLRKIIDRKRPCEALGTESRIGEKKSGSFPSNHSACSAVISISFIWAFPPWGYILIPAALLTGLSRIISGVHYPCDVLCGFAVGGITGYLGFFVF